ncbi:tetratricopeptide repeat protein [Bacteroides caecigallinarum]|uniref:tetratricopeptide repeat protein n=1 Tax=Bacteroides caecigallinarum TaxID=1411144 RepID=UPI001F310C3A|nr:tetratricopeptide repeat protein [Bacteroides caecigallinarum]MCF2581634.1 tetratricopeptide repeat protein [Bacteroides caecigallinarum]MDN0053933.1 tetratricopeptide repeat protein [Bacteroides caecigallinarum]
MNNILENIRIMIKDGRIAEAKEALDMIIEQNTEDTDMAYYLKGNACRKLGDWQGALNNYQEAININPESPAKDARAMMMDILNFYNKDMFNQ